MRIEGARAVSSIHALPPQHARWHGALSHTRLIAIVLIFAFVLLALWALPASGARITPVATPPGQPPPAAAATPPEDPPPPALDATQALRDSQAAIGRQLGDHALLDTQGKPVRLSAYRGKPLLVSFIYTGCFQVCPTSTRSLQEAVRTLHKTFRAEHFNVVSIGFNQPADSPPAMRAFAAQHRIDEPNWQFLSAPSAALPALLRDFGFSYLATPAGFDHLVGVTVVDAQGRIYAQVYGEKFSPDQLGEPLRLLLRGAPLPAQLNLAELIERVRIVCTVYDPSTGSYRYNYGLIVEIAGGATFIVAVLWFFALELRNRWRRRALQRALPAADVAL
jgi:protein SCO1